MSDQNYRADVGGRDSLSPGSPGATNAKAKSKAHSGEDGDGVAASREGNSLPAITQDRMFGDLTDAQGLGSADKGMAKHPAPGRPGNFDYPESGKRSGQQAEPALAEETKMEDWAVAKGNNARPSRNLDEQNAYR